MVRWTHRHIDDMDIYFVANGEVADKLPFAGKSILANCSFRAAGAEPEFWDPETGKISPVPAYEFSNGLTHIPIAFQAKGSVFVVFRQKRSANVTAAIRSVSHHGKLLFAASSPARPHIQILSASYGVPGDAAHTRNVTAIVQKLVNRGDISFPVVQIAALGGDPDPGVVKTLDIHYTVNGHEGHINFQDGQHVHFNLTPGPHIKILSASYGVPGQPKHTRNVTAIVQKLVNQGDINFPVVQIAAIGGDPDPGVVKTLDIRYQVNGHKGHISSQDGSWVSFAGAEPAHHQIVALEAGNDGHLKAIVTEPGKYECVFTSGKRSTINVSDIPRPVAIDGPWRVKFPSGWGAPAEIHIEKLIAWNNYHDAGVRYFSGTAEYHTDFAVPAELLAPNRRIYLDLGDVAVMARVILNDHDLGILWKPPFRMDVTRWLKSGTNTLHVHVTNLWINRMIGDEQLPQDSERGPGGNLLKWPQWLLEDKPSPTGRFTFTTWQHWHKTDPLVESGLIGPVKLTAAAMVSLQ